VKIIHEEFTGYYKKYAELIDGESYVELFDKSIKSFLDTVEKIPSNKYLFKYEDNKWTVKEVIQHCIDTERVFAYRALAITRGETEIKSFSENDYAKNANANFLKWENIIEDLIYTRANSKSLYNSFSEEHLKLKAQVAENELSVSTIAFIICGHLMHHKNILEERYLSA